MIIFLLLFGDVDRIILSSYNVKRFLLFILYLVLWFSIVCFTHCWKTSLLMTAEPEDLFVKRIPHSFSLKGEKLFIFSNYVYVNFGKLCFYGILCPLSFQFHRNKTFIMFHSDSRDLAQWCNACLSYMSQGCDFHCHCIL